MYYLCNVLFFTFIVTKIKKNTSICILFIENIIYLLFFLIYIKIKEIDKQLLLLGINDRKNQHIPIIETLHIK